MLDKYTEWVVAKVSADLTDRLSGVPAQLVLMIRENFEKEQFAEKFLAKMKKHKADRSPSRKSDSKKGKGKGNDTDTPKPAKKRKDANAPKGVRNAKTMFKIDRAADLAGLSRDDRFKREKELWNELTETQKNIYMAMYDEDKKRFARETELYKKGEFVPGKTPLPEIKRDPEPAKEEPKTASIPTVKKKKKVSEEEKKKTKKTTHKKPSSSSSSSDDCSMGEDSDD